MFILVHKPYNLWDVLTLEMHYLYVALYFTGGFLTINLVKWKQISALWFGYP